MTPTADGNANRSADNNTNAGADADGSNSGCDRSTKLNDPMPHL